MDLKTNCYITIFINKIINKALNFDQIKQIKNNEEILKQMLENKNKIQSIVNSIIIEDVANIISEYGMHIEFKNIEMYNMLLIIIRNEYISPHNQTFIQKTCL